MHMPIPAKWLESLHLTHREGKDLIVDKKQSTASPYARIISDALDAGVSGVFCVGDKPCAALLVAPDNSASSKKELQKLYKILWNQGEFDYLIVLFPEVAAIHTFSSTPDEWGTRPILGDGKPSPTWLAALHIATDAVALSEVITGMYRPARQDNSEQKERMRSCIRHRFRDHFPSAMMEFALSVLITPATFSACVCIRVSESRFDRLPVMS